MVIFPLTDMSLLPFSQCRSHFLLSTRAASSTSLLEDERKSLVAKSSLMLLFRPWWNTSNKAHLFHSFAAANNLIFICVIIHGSAQIRSSEKKAEWSAYFWWLLPLCGSHNLTLSVSNKIPKVTLFQRKTKKAKITTFLRNVSYAIVKVKVWKLKFCQCQLSSPELI